MSETLLEALQESTEEVLEKMFFIQGLEAEPGLVEESEVSARIHFEGDPSGELILSVTAAAARSVAADFLGAEEQDLSQDQIGDVVGELANMICGSVLSRVESSATFRLASPQIVAVPAAGSVVLDQSGATPDSAARRAAHAVAIGSGRLVTRIHTEAPAWTRAVKSAY